MKKFVVSVVVAGFAFGPAFASDLEEYCVGYVTESGGDPSGCACLAEAADDDMTSELLEVASAEDIEGLSEASQEAIASCFPGA